MAGGGGAEAGVVPEITLEYTPTWIVASVCAVIVVISLLFERMLHRLGKVRPASSDLSLSSCTMCTSLLSFVHCSVMSSHSPNNFNSRQQRLLKRSKKTQYDVRVKHDMVCSVACALVCGCPDR